MFPNLKCGPCPTHSPRCYCHSDRPKGPCYLPEWSPNVMLHCFQVKNLCMSGSQPRVSLTSPMGTPGNFWRYFELLKVEGWEVGPSSKTEAMETSQCTGKPLPNFCDKAPSPQCEAHWGYKTQRIQRTSTRFSTWSLPIVYSSALTYSVSPPHQPPQRHFVSRAHHTHIIPVTSGYIIQTPCLKFSDPIAFGNLPPYPFLHHHTVS